MSNNESATPKNSRRAVLRAAGYGLFASAATFAYADIGADRLVVETRTLDVPTWDANDFRVAVVSDLHANSHREASVAAEACRLAIEASPDVIVLPGDFVNFSGPVTLQHLRDALSPLREATCPVIATLGNHDYWARSPRHVIDTIKEFDLHLLRNQAFDMNGVTIFGVDDAIAGLHRPDAIRAGAHSKSMLALLHEPDFVDDMPTFVSLQISGHSHGGQICLPGGLSMHTPFGARKYIAGFYPDAPVPLYVSRGVGTVGPRLRLFCRPEVSVLTVRSA